MDFIQICEKYRIPFRTTGDHTSRGWVQVDCPYCGPGTGKFHLGYNIRGGRFNCWNCGKKLRNETFQMLTNLPPALLKQLLADLPKQIAETGVLQASGKLRLPRGVVPLQKPHKRYLASRGHDWRVIRDVWNVQCTDHSSHRLPWRLFIPFEYNHKTVSWTTRTISTNPDTLRYITATREEEAIFHKHLLYGYDHAAHVVIIVEGVFDVWRIGPGAVGILGTRVSREQLQLLSNFAVRYICFDTGAERYAERLAEQLRLFPGETHVIWLEDSKDPDSASPNEIRQLRKLLK